MKRKSIAVRYAAYILGLFLMLAVAVAGVNCFLTRKSETFRLERQVSHFVESHLYTAVRELWLTDYVEVQRQINTISEFNYIAYIEIIDDEGESLTAGKWEPRLELVYDHPVSYEYKAREVIIGSARIYTDNSIIAGTVRVEFVRLFLMLSASSILIALMVSLFFNRMLGRHIISLSSFLLKEHEELVHTDFILDRKPGRNDELTRLADSINKMRHNIRVYDANEKQLKNSLERENRFKNRLFSIISHDLKSPLNSFTGLTDSLIEDFDRLSGDSMLSILKEINKSSSSLALLVENLLEWSGLDNIDSDYKPELFEFMPLLSETSDLFSRMLADKSVRLNIDVPDALEVYGDYRMIATVFRNLISNAIKFTPRGGTVTVGAEVKKGAVWFSVKDTGSGMSSEQINSVLSGGQAGSTRGTEGEKGTGLGLVLCIEFIKINGGSLNIKSDAAAGGTEILLSLPSSS